MESLIWVFGVAMSIFIGICIDEKRIDGGMKHGWSKKDIILSVFGFIGLSVTWLYYLVGWCLFSFTEFIQK